MEQNRPPAAAAAGAIGTFMPVGVRQRVDGWTPERQRLFCEVLAECGLVRDAAAAVGMSVQSAYSLRRRPNGRAFAIAWDAALYLARQRLVDMAIEQAVDGNRKIVSKNGQVVSEKVRKDVRLLLATITKLENSQSANSVARTVAGEFEEFLDCMQADAVTPATPDTATPRSGHAGYFLEVREPAGGLDRQRHRDYVQRLAGARPRAVAQEDAPVLAEITQTMSTSWTAF